MFVSHAWESQDYIITNEWEPCQGWLHTYRRTKFGEFTDHC